ncbi:transcriptional regulator [Streptomyces cavernicola]|uniref:Transcriptional regulator n=1 Tax=Streptomyces cavernicola TaxID=3043613 RepID=A0ABT6S8H5_9ACTN|nr:transcriptional regulator [Streptomyces sp. B-S-A6]MDI3404184.1 transcriptional regulator [Streptomyces sp. B-S-A6]
MALRIHFTADDLARTVVSASPDVMWELVNSLHILQSRRPAAVYGPWLRHVRARLTASDHRRVVRLLTTLVPPRGGFPDFLTPANPGRFDASLDLVRSTPAGRLRQDLAQAFDHRAAPMWVRRLADGDQPVQQELGHALAVYHDEFLAPHWPRVDQCVHGERARRSRDVLDGGVGQLLQSLELCGRWTAPTLTCSYPRDRDLHLKGRGITLIPSYFCTRFPVTFIDPELPPILVYPATHQSRPANTPRAALSALLGRTRATVLCSLDTPCSTSELALRSGVSIPSASQHASTLRNAGLISSSRQRSAMLHTLTRLGRELAHGPTP